MGPRREVVVGDGVEWLRRTALPADAALVTSLPDASEIPGLGLEAWSAWFVDTAALVCERTPSGSVAVFFQTDVVTDGVWIDKAHLVARGAERAGARCRFHRIVCRGPAGTRTRGRPGYAHLLAFSDRALPADVGMPDVLPELGEMPWARAMGTAVCEAVCRELLPALGSKVVVDPFCGHGTVLAVANAAGLDAIGVEIVEAHAARAREIRFHPGVGIR